MATKTYYAYANGGSATVYRGKVTLTETVDVANNKSTITYHFWLYRADGYTGAAHSFQNGNKLVVTMNGVTLINSSNYKAVTLTGTSEASPFLMCTGSITVPHNSDGKKSFSFSFAYDQTQNAGQTLDYLTVSGTHECTAIARASAVSASETCAFGSAATITITAASSSFTHTLRYSFCSKTGTIKTNAAASTSWTLPTSLMTEIPNNTQSWITIYCDTYSGSTKIGTTSCTMTVNVPASVVPTLSVAVSEAATIPSGITGYIQGRSKFRVKSTAAGASGSSIKFCSVTINGTTYSGTDITSNVITRSGTIAVTVKVTDSRGRATSKTTNVTVAAYSQPKMSSVTAYRCKSASDAAADPDGAYIVVKPRGSITALNDKNGKTCAVYYKKQTDSAYTRISLTMGDYVLDTEQVIFAADAGSTYDIYVTLTDSFTTARINATSVMSGGAKLHFFKKRLGIGKRAEIDGIDIGWDTRIRKNLIVEKLFLNGVVHRCSYAFTYDSGVAGKWVCLGKLKIGNSAWSTIIDLYSGGGYNGHSSQNTLISIFVKDAYQAAASETLAFGVSYTVQHAPNEDIVVRAMATSDSEVLIWVKIPWTYANGYYEVHGRFQSWTHINQIQDNTPSTGTEQQVTKY